jgi:iron complex transport system substrate-binding protein
VTDSERGLQRIVCLTEETTETLYLLGEQDRIAGISGFTCRPKEARQKPKVSAFITAKIDKILELQPDLVIGFSNLQADIASELIRAGVNVWITNQRSIDQILQTMLLLARIVGAHEEGSSLVRRLRSDLDSITKSARSFPFRPRVFFEEWMEPLISGICWVDELVEIAGGEPVFPQLRSQQDAKGRIVDPAAVVERDPDVIIASWCGRKVNKAKIRERPGWQSMSAVQKNHIYEIKSTYILQPGPAALTEGVRQLHTILAHVVGWSVLGELMPAEALDADV